MKTQNLNLEVFSGESAFLNPVSRSGFHHHREVEIKDGMSIGRGGGNGLILEDPYVSLRHGRIKRFDQFFVLKDLESLNGTYINGTRVREAILHHQDRVQFGKSDFIFSYERDQREEFILGSSLKEDWDMELQRLPHLSKSDFSVLITGPTGSGKEHIAKRIHKKSRRSLGPFFSLNCSAFQENLIESELFGHQKGSFTGALYQRKGAFESARGGSLFLDEIGELPLSMQAKLLRVLETSEFKPLGSDQFSKADVRIIAATHQDLEKKLSEGEFRADLFYRLNVLSIQVPSLKERVKDFENILYFFSRKMQVRFSLKAIEVLKSYHWPGNIRELKNFVSRCSAYFPSGSLITDVIVYKLLKPTTSYVEKPLTCFKSRHSMIQMFEKTMIEKALFQNGGNQRKSAEMLNMPRSTFSDRLRIYKISAKSFKKKMLEIKGD